MCRGIRDMSSILNCAQNASNVVVITLTKLPNITIDQGLEEETGQGVHAALERWMVGVGYDLPTEEVVNGCNHRPLK
jgi:hypothetical protein